MKNEKVANWKLGHLRNIIEFSILPCNQSQNEQHEQKDKFWSEKHLLLTKRTKKEKIMKQKHK